MALEEINTKLAQIALEHCEGFPFERFANDFLAATDGLNFIPIGGTSDGGADGIQEQGLFSIEKSEVFYQMSIEQNHRSKIKKTIDRLIEFGRTPKRLIYVTSQVIGIYDKEEEALTDKHDVFIRIRDAKWILSHLNYNEATKKAYYTHLATYTDFLKDLNNAEELKINHSISHPAVYVFLQQQVENKKKDKHLTKTVADSLIIWSLNGTDPDKGIFFTRKEILDNISKNIPWAKKIVGGILNNRLTELSSSRNTNSKKIKHHTKGDKFCLPYETRKIIIKEKAEDESLRLDVINEIILSELLTEFNPEEQRHIANLSLRTAQLFFEKEGLSFSSFLNGNEDLEIKEKDSLIENTVYDRVADSLNETSLNEDMKSKYNPIICKISRKLFYQSSESQRILLNKFSRTYILLFTLQAEPRVVEYFQQASANFRLLVGTDLIIRAISERFLSKENQMTRNLFAMAKSSGINLLLTEQALEGVINHIIVTDNEFRNHIQPRAEYMTMDLIRESKQILIRTYFYSKKEGYGKTWSQFISEFVTYLDIRNTAGKEELKTYIQQQFGMEYISVEELKQGVSSEDIDKLAESILEIKQGNKPLAKHISLTINAVYAQRRLLKEHSTFPEYGYQTWWLTQESRVQKHTLNIVKENGAKYIMRPEFLLNFFSLAPSVTDIKNSYKTIFPSAMGIQMGNRLPDDLFHKVLEQVDIWRDTEDGRITAKTRTLCDKLKAEYYDSEINYNSIDRILSEIE